MIYVCIYIYMYISLFLCEFFLMQWYVCFIFAPLFARPELQLCPGGQNGNFPQISREGDVGFHVILAYLHNSQYIGKISTYIMSICLLPMFRFCLISAPKVVFWHGPDVDGIWNSEIKYHVNLVNAFFDHWFIYIYICICYVYNLICMFTCIFNMYFWGFLHRHSFLHTGLNAYVFKIIFRHVPTWANFSLKRGPSYCVIVWIECRSWTWQDLHFPPSHPTIKIPRLEWHQERSAGRLVYWLVYCKRNTTHVRRCFPCLFCSFFLEWGDLQKVSAAV